jgi:hypothetical protein
MKTTKFDKLWKDSPEVFALLVHKKHFNSVPLHIVAVRECKVREKNTKCKIAMKADFKKKLACFLIIWNPDYKYKRLGILTHELTHAALWMHHRGFPEEVICESTQIIMDRYSPRIKNDDAFKRKGAK